MTENSDLMVESFDRDDMRDIVSVRVKNLKSQFRLMPLKLNRFIKALSEQLNDEWIKENKEFVKANKGEKPLVRLERWKSWSKIYRTKGLVELSKVWYPVFWKLRSDLALTTAIYEFSEINDISTKKQNIKKNIAKDIKPIVMRMKGPRKPTKKKILLKDVSYDLKQAFLEMTQKLEEKTLMTRELINKLVAPRKKLKIEVKIKRYKDAYLAREYMTVITQAVAPRQ